MSTRLKTCLCTQAQLESEPFRAWCPRMKIRHGLHRKLWEHCYIAQALDERGMLAPGKRGLGFGVGTEPLVALFASSGCEIVATDLAPEVAHRDGWDRDGQYMESLEALNRDGLCSDSRFRRNVRMRFVDMNEIPTDLSGFDFTWSSSSLDHCGTLEKAKAFLYRQMDCLKPGGVAVHTTEYNVSSNERTIEAGPTVCFRKRDVEEVARRLKTLGHGIELDLALGDGPADRYVDEPPYTHNPHLRLRWCEFVATSIGFAIDRGGGSALRLRRFRPLAWWSHLRRATG